MSQENVEIVRAAFAAYMSDDEQTFRQLTAPDIVISTRPGQPDVHDHRGYAGLLQSSAEWLEAWDEHIFEAACMWDVEEFVFVHTRESGLGRMSRVPIETESVFVCTLSEGRITRMQSFETEADALKAVGLEE
jgi:ketosteroid isomerase-like protein